MSFLLYSHRRPNGKSLSFSSPLNLWFNNNDKNGIIAKLLREGRRNGESFPHSMPSTHHPYLSSDARMCVSLHVPQTMLSNNKKKWFYLLDSVCLWIYIEMNKWMCFCCLDEIAEKEVEVILCEWVWVKWNI